MSLFYQYALGAGNAAQTAPINDSGNNMSLNVYKVTVTVQVLANGTAILLIPTSGKLYGVEAISCNLADGTPIVPANYLLERNAAGQVLLTALNANFAAGGTVTFIAAQSL